MSVNRDPYVVLGVARTATAAEITRAYRSRLRALHPDTRADAVSASDADAQLSQLIAAYAALRDAAAEPAAAPGTWNAQGPVQIRVTYGRAQPYKNPNNTE